MASADIRHSLGVGASGTQEPTQPSWEFLSIYYTEYEVFITDAMETARSFTQHTRTEHTHDLSRCAYVRYPARAD